MSAIKFRSVLSFNLTVTAEIDKDGIDDFKVMLDVGGISIDITHSLSREQRKTLEQEAMHLACGRTIWGGI